MSKIQVLDQNVANQIAAGEVVERPYSVVKELLENSIDAGATMISVDIMNGGIDYIRVSDNGRGIQNEECRTAFLPHATSKIVNINDIHHIYTLGFRGEALPSIASIADVTLKSRTKDDVNGNQVHISYGTLIEEKPCACTEGTSVEVRNMFEKTPARLKFLKSERTEAGYIGDYISRMIMAYPEISFSYTNNGKKTYHSYGDNNLINAVFSIYGSETLPYLKEVNFDDGYLKINGYIGSQELTKPNRQYQSFFVNRRYIRSSLLSTSLQTAFETRIMSGRYPFAVINITIASTEVDINVHPTKMDVRFSDEQRVFNTLLEACDLALEQKQTDSNEHETSEYSRPQNTSFTDHKFAQRANADFKVIRDYSFQPKEPTTETASVKNVDLFQIHTGKAVVAEKAVQDTLGFADEEYKIVGSVFAGYWIVEQGDSVYFIDQHAAHERRLYEKIMSREVEVASQKLLSPVYLKLTELDLSVLQQCKEELESFGFELDYLDDGVNVASVPVISSYILKPTDLIDVLNLINTEKGITPKQYIREALIQSSCKHAIKITETVTEKEILQLLSEYESNNVPMTCPHGRPVMIKMTKYELEKLFKRKL